MHPLASALHLLRAWRLFRRSPVRSSLFALSDFAQANARLVRFAFTDWRARVCLNASTASTAPQSSKGRKYSPKDFKGSKRSAPFFVQTLEFRESPRKVLAQSAAFKVGKEGEEPADSVDTEPVHFCSVLQNFCSLMWKFDQKKSSSLSLSLLVRRSIAPSTLACLSAIQRKHPATIRGMMHECGEREWAHSSRSGGFIE